MTKNKNNEQQIKALLTEMAGPKGHLVKRPDFLSHDEWVSEIIKAFSIPPFPSK